LVSTATILNSSRFGRNDAGNVQYGPSLTRRLFDHSRYSSSLIREEKEEEDNSGTGYEDGCTLFSITARKPNDETTHFRLLVQLQNELNDTIVRSLIINGSRVFNDFIVGVKSYKF
jgi:G3E family GTPase